MRDNWGGLIVAVMLVAIGSLKSGALLFPSMQIPLWSLLPVGFVLLAEFAYRMIDGTYHLGAADEDTRFIDR